MDLEQSPTSLCDAQMQWSDPWMEDHPMWLNTCTTPPELQPAASYPLTNNADCLLYIGIPLLEFHTLVSCLQGFAPTSSAMPAADQILMTPITQIELCHC